LPRGGVVVAYEIAQLLHVPLDVYLVRKLGAPGQPELAIGAIAENGAVFLNDSIISILGVTEKEINSLIEFETLELQRRRTLYREGLPLLQFDRKTVIVVDDGLATGASMKVALRAIKQQNPSWVVVAVPVGAPSTVHELSFSADEVVCLITPEPMMAVGTWYENFEQVKDVEVKTLLRKSHSSLNTI
jgi:putative phosphoribosyl transferase